MEHSDDHPGGQLSILRDFLSGLNLGKVDLVLEKMQSNFITSVDTLDAAIQNGTGQNILDPKGLAQKLGLTRVRARKVLRALVARRELTKAIEKTNLHDPDVLIQLFDIANLFSIAAVEKLDTNTLAKTVGLTRTQSRKILRVLEKGKRPVQESEASVSTNVSAIVQSLETGGNNYDTVTMNQEATNLPIASTRTNDGFASNETTQVASSPYSPQSQKPISPANLKSEPELLVNGMDFLRQVVEGAAAPAVVRKLSSNVPLRSFEMGRDKHTTVHEKEPNATNFESSAKKAPSPRPFLSEQKVALQNNTLDGDVRIFNSHQSTNINHDDKDMSEHQSNLGTQGDVVVNTKPYPAFFGSKFASEVNNLHNMKATKNNLVIPQPTSQTEHVVSHSMPTSVTSVQNQSESGVLHSANITSEPGTAQHVRSLVDVGPLVSASPYHEEEMTTPTNIENMHALTHGPENVREDNYSPKSHAHVRYEKEQLRLARLQMFKDDDSRLLNESSHIEGEQALNEVQIEKNIPTENDAIQRENRSNANDLDVVSKDVPEPVSSLMFADQTRDKVNVNPYQTETTGNNGWQGKNSDVVVFESNAKNQQSGNSSGTLTTRVGVNSELSISRGDSVDQKAKSTSTKAENQKLPHAIVARDTTTINIAPPTSHGSHQATRQSLISSDFSYSSANPASADDILISEATFQAVKRALARTHAKQNHETTLIRWRSRTNITETPSAVGCIGNHFLVQASPSLQSSTGHFLVQASPSLQSSTGLLSSKISLDHDLRSSISVKSNPILRPRQPKSYNTPHRLPRREHQSKRHSQIFEDVHIPGVPNIRQTSHTNDRRRSFESPLSNSRDVNNRFIPPHKRQTWKRHNVPSSVQSKKNGYQHCLDIDDLDAALYDLHNTSPVHLSQGRTQPINPRSVGKLSIKPSPPGLAQRVGKPVMSAPFSRTRQSERDSFLQDKLANFLKIQARGINEILNLIPFSPDRNR